MGNIARNCLLIKAEAEHGETLAEVLVAILISSLSLLMLATAIASSTNIVRKAIKISEDYREANNALAEGTNASEDVADQGEGTVSVVDPFRGSTDEAPSVTYTKSKKDFPGGNVGISYKFKPTGDGE